MSLKALFVCSGRAGISPIVWAQGQSLIKIGVEVEFFTIKKRGIKGYIASVLPLRRRIKETKPDLVHAHYSLCGFVSSWATRKPVLASLMGSDLMSSGLWRIVIRFFCAPCLVYDHREVRRHEKKSWLDSR